MEKSRKLQSTKISQLPKRMKIWLVLMMVTKRREGKDNNKYLRLLPCDKSGWAQ
jgi:hypothetical protein